MYCWIWFPSILLRIFASCPSVILACEVSVREIKETIPFTAASKRIKYLGITYLRRQKICTLKTMTLMKETGHDTNRRKAILCSWIGRINSVTVTILPKTVYRFSAIPIKTPMAFFIELEQKNFKFV